MSGSEIEQTHTGFIVKTQFQAQFCKNNSFKMYALARTRSKIPKPVLARNGKRVQDGKNEITQMHLLWRYFNAIVIVFYSFMIYLFTFVFYLLSLKAENSWGLHFSVCLPI